MRKYDIIEKIETRDTGKRVALKVPLPIADWSTEYQSDSAPRKLEYIHRIQMGCKTVVSDSRKNDRDPVAESRTAATRLIADVIFGEARSDLLKLVCGAYANGQEELAAEIMKIVDRMTP